MHNWVPDKGSWGSMLAHTRAIVRPCWGNLWGVRPQGYDPRTPDTVILGFLLDSWHQAVGARSLAPPPAASDLESRFGAQISYSLNFSKGSMVGVIKGDTRSSDSGGGVVHGLGSFVRTIIVK